MTEESTIVTIWRRWGIVLIVALIMAAKWSLVCMNEIVSEPYDALNYVRGALDLNDAGYPLWLWLCHKTGLPQRLLIECLWLGASLAFALSLAQAAGRRWLVIPALAALAWSPTTLFMFDRAMTEGLFACLSLLLATGALGLLACERARGRVLRAVAMGLLAGWMTIIRNETLLIVPFLLVLALAWATCERWHRHRPWPEIARWGLALGMLVSITTALPGVAVATRNYLKHGVYTVNLPNMPSHMGLLKRLAAIDPGKPNIRYIPISRTARELAYAASPTLARFRPVVEDPASVYLRVTREAHGIDGDIGGGWIWHVFNVAAPSIGASNLADIDALYRQAVSELDAAFVDGSLRRRFVPHPFLGSDIQAWTPYLGEGIAHVTRCILTPSPAMLDQGHASDVFDRVCLRRQALIPQQTTTITGWAFAHDPTHPIERIDLLLQGQAAPLQLFEQFPRPDVQQGFAAQGVAVPATAGFRLIANTGADQVGLAFLRADGRTLTTWPELTVGRAITLPGDSGLPLADAGIDAIVTEGPARDHGWRGRVFSLCLAIGSSWLAWSIVTIGVMAAVGWACWGRYETIASPLALVLATIGCWVVGRALFYAVITAGAWVAEPRYLQTATIHLTCCLLIGLALFFARPQPVSRP